MDAVTPLRQHRRRLGLSQTEFARACGLSRATVAALEAGERSPRWESRWKLSSFLGLDEAVLFGPALEPERTEFKRVSADDLASMLRRLPGRVVAFAVPSIDVARALDYPEHVFNAEKARVLIKLGHAVARLEARGWLISTEYTHDAANAEVTVRVEALSVPPAEEQ